MMRWSGVFVQKQVLGDWSLFRTILDVVVMEG
jgi:hypothetical protein